MELRNFKRKLSKTFSLCSRALRKSITVIPFSIIKNKVQTVHIQTSCSFSDDNLRRWTNAQENEKARLRSLNCCPSPPKRPPKRFQNQMFMMNEKEQKNGKFSRPTKRRLPTPPDSPISSVSSRRESLLADESISILSEETYESCTEVSSIASVDSSIYSSNDSGRGTSADSVSELSDDSEQLTGAKHKIQNDGKKHKVPTKRETGSKKTHLENTIEILKAVKDNIDNKVSVNDDELLDIIISLGQFMPGQYIEKLHWYVADVERITLLMNSLARSLARVEKKILHFEEVMNVTKELNRKKKNISEQLNKTKDKNSYLADEFLNILSNVEKHLGVKIKDNFVDIMETKSKLLITSRELEEKINLRLQEEI